ncbi:hypothetical protein Glove_67g91 [Diversispora epigaea]|uniref:Uncharacterized protein n=1 Tax=Diversispora epigaea TaxID=1348612 RepID=A0A397JET6_9GLOM|nr:hypothetical protein Glove_67g91 [Diversispora epigaea]
MRIEFKKNNIVHDFHKSSAATNFEDLKAAEARKKGLKSMVIYKKTKDRIGRRLFKCLKKNKSKDIYEKLGVVAEHIGSNLAKRRVIDGIMIIKKIEKIKKNETFNLIVNMVKYLKSSNSEAQGLRGVGKINDDVDDEGHNYDDEDDSPGRLIKIFNDNFNKLRLSFDCRDEFDANELLWKTNTNIPIKIQMDCYDPQILSADSLTKYFEGAKEEKLL